MWPQGSATSLKKVAKILETLYVAWLLWSFYDLVFVTLLLPL